MKKLIVVTLMSILFTSCGSEVDEKTTVVETPKDIENETIITDDEIDVEIKKIEETLKEEIIENIEDKVDWGTTIEKTETEWTSDEDALEAEVNDLLDEFIDSLDSYDK